MQQQKTNIQLIEMDELFRSLINIRDIAREINFDAKCLQQYRNKINKGKPVRYETKEKFLNHCGFTIVQQPLFAIEDKTIQIDNATLTEVKTFTRADLIAFAKMLDKNPALTTSPAYAADKFIANKFN